MGFNTLNDVYLKVFYPAAMNKTASFIVGSAPSAVYNQNAGFDRDNKGYITRSDITRTINGIYDKAVLLPPVVITALIWSQVVTGIAVAGAALYALRVKGKI